jgi:hypothetical protein
MDTSIPPPAVLMRAAKISIDEDAPLYFDYYADSLANKCSIGVRDGVKYLVKSDTEYTSSISTVFKCETCYIIKTENSVYIVSADIRVKKIVAESTQGE